MWRGPAWSLGRQMLCSCQALAWSWPSRTWSTAPWMTQRWAQSDAQIKCERKARVELRTAPALQLLLSGMQLAMDWMWLEP